MFYKVIDLLNAKHTSYINISRFDTNGNFHKDKQEILQFFVTFTKLNKKFCSFFHKDNKSKLKKTAEAIKILQSLTQKNIRGYQDPVVTHSKRQQRQYQDPVVTHSKRQQRLSRPCS